MINHTELLDRLESPTSLNAQLEREVAGKAIRELLDSDIAWSKLSIDTQAEIESLQEQVKVLRNVQNEVFDYVEKTFPEIRLYAGAKEHLFLDRIKATRGE